MPQARNAGAVSARRFGAFTAQDLPREVLLLTKMNWNSARFAERLPVTVRFAGKVGALLRDLSDDYESEGKYTFCT
ncbi:hypothetical protein [Streptomyces sp. NPDC005538]|uniref:hypothetical protein n=1 Tax=Streptomyces sp. NPDC005538 TaxID=3157043 RepID=UPI0033B0BD8E